MRPQQKSFVVEIKSKGRRASVRNGSIWGTTDLKALARQAAGIAPQLFDEVDEPTRIDEARVETIAQATPTAPFVELASTSFVIIATPAASGLEPSRPDDNAKVDGAREHGGIVKQSREPVEPPRSPRPSSRAPKTPRASKTAALMRTRMPHVSTGELTALEIENTRLKALWAAHLRKENEQLQTMLDRFF